MSATPNRFALNDAPKPKPQKNSRRAFRIFAWIAASLVLIVLVCAIGLVAMINNGGVHRRIIDIAQSKASQELGVRVQLQNFTLHLSTLSLDLYGITVDGAAPYLNPPLLQLQHVAAGVRIVSIFGGKWYFDDIRVDRPVAWVLIGKSGVSNIPKPQSSSNSNSDTSVFDLGIRHVLLDQGEVYFNSRPSALAADLHNLDFHSSFNSLLKMYSGELAYSNGNLQYGSMHPVAHNLDVKFDATPSTFHLTRAHLSSGPSQIDLSATLQNYNNPAVAALYDASIDGSQLGQILQVTSMPAGVVRVNGSLQYEQAVGRSPIQSLVIHGDFSSRQLRVTTAAARADIHNLVAHYSLANGDATLRDLRAGLLGGELSAQGTMKDIAGQSHSQFNAALRGISLSQARQSLGRNAPQTPVALKGALNATASASWGATINDLLARADVTLKGQVARGQSNGRQIVVEMPAGRPVNTTSSAASNSAAIPVESVIHALYSGANHEIQMNASYLRTPQTDLTLNGAVGDRSRLALRLQANDLREIATIAELFESPQAGQATRQLDLSGSASFQGALQGATDAPHLTGQLTATNLHINGTGWKSLSTGVDASPSHAALQHADIEAQPHGRITLNAAVDLNKWAFTDRSPIQLELSASQVNLASLEKVAGEQLPVTGTLNANLALHGSELNPMGNGNLALTGVTAYEEPIQFLKVNFSGSGDQARADLSLQLPAGAVQGKLTVQPKQRTYTADLASTGIQLEKLQAVKAKNIDVTGVLALRANGQGSFDNPQLIADIQIPKLVIQNQPFSAIKLDLNVADHIGNATLSSTAVGASIQAKARVNLSGDYLADASLDTNAFPLQPTLAAYAPEQEASISGQTELHATLHGPLKNRDLVEAHLTIPVLKVGYNNSIQLAATAPIKIDYKNEVVTLQPAAISGTDTDLKFQATVPINSGAPISFLAQGTVNLQLAQLFDPDLRTSGELKLNINSHGPLNGADIGGEIDIVDANFSSSDMPVGLQHGNGVLKLTSDRLNIDKFQGSVGGGTVTAQGGIAYRPSLEFDLGVAANGVRVLYPQGMREGVDADLRLTGSLTDALLGGSVNLSDLSFTPAFDLSNFISQFSGGVSIPSTPGFSQDLALNIAVRSTNNVNLVSRTLSVGGSANLQVRGTAAEPVILGRVNLSGGDIILNGNRFVLTGGTIQFVNPSETEPVINVAITTSIQQYNISLRFNGPVSQLRTEYSSDPALPTADIINLLALGSTTEANNPLNTDQQAESLVASQVSSQVTSRVSKVAGISQLSISPVLAGSSSQGPPGANLTIQQRITGNLFVTFSTNVASTQSQIIQGQYQVSPRVAVSATRDPNGGFAVDTLIKKSW